MGGVWFVIGVGVGLGFSKRRRGRGSQPLVFDDFNRPDNALSLGTAKTGQSWIVEGEGGVYGIQDNRLYLSESGTVTEPTATINSGISDCVISAEFYGGPEYTGGNPSSGICFRQTDNLNLFRFYPDNLHFRMARVVAGVVTVMGSNNAIAPINNQILRVVLSGQSIKCYVGDLLVFDVTHNFNQTTTKHGLYSRNRVVTARWDNFRVEVLPS